MPSFLKHIAPALEARLARSPLTGHTGELKITEYRRGFRMVFEDGNLTAVEPWQSMDSEGGDANAAFPPLVFLQLLFGRRSLADLRAAFPDCWAQDEATVLLNVLFPSQSSCVMPVG